MATLELPALVSRIRMRQSDRLAFRKREMARSFLGDSLHYLSARVAYRIGRHFYHKCLKPRGIRAAEYWVLTLLEERDGRTVGEIASNIFYDQPATTRLLERMAEQDMIQRRGTPQDKRKMLAFISKRGKNLVTELQRLADEDERQGTRSFSLRELEALKSSLRRAIADLVERESIDNEVDDAA